MAEGATLASRLSQVLPIDRRFKYFHISTPPTTCVALFAPPTGEDEQRTFCESHCFILCLDEGNNGPVAILAVEVLIYTTATLTTLFVSKADSTGFAGLLQLPKSFPSIIRSATSTFISHLVEYHHRSDRRLVLSLFARAQRCYLFPGSDENPSKHVLDDRTLVKWWCRTLEPVLARYPSNEEGMQEQTTSSITSRAYVIVPGHDQYETRAFFPPSARQANQTQWVHGHPLLQIAPKVNAPPRCLIPHFPDDPKARFLDDLDDELNDAPSSQQSVNASPSKRGRGRWKSVHNLGQFWEMMAYRQECSSGRLVGFLWMVFSPSKSFSTHKILSPLPDAARTGSEQPASTDIAKPRKTATHRRLTGKIVSRSPRIKSSISKQESSSFPERTKHYYYPKPSRGILVVEQKAYDRLHESLLRLNFANLEAAVSSTAKWASDAAAYGRATVRDWGIPLRGSKQFEKATVADRDANAIRLLSGKRKPEAQDSVRDGDSAKEINLISSSMVRKKSKTVDAAAKVADQVTVNTLGSSLIKRKAK